MSDDHGPKKKLVLHIEVEGFNADDLDEMADIWADGDPGDRARERLYVVTEEWVRPDVGLTLVTVPGDKCMNDDFDVVAFNGRIVGAETRDREKTR